MGRGLGRVTHDVNEALIDNVSVNENPLEHNEEIEKEVEIEDVDEDEQEEGMQAEATGIPTIDLVLITQIISFLKGLAGTGMLPPTQTHTNPLVARTVPMTSEVGGNNVVFCHFWVL